MTVFFFFFFFFFFVFTFILFPYIFQQTQQCF
jgi:hypothetical protein